MRNLPTFASQTIGAHRNDTRNGAMSAFCGAIIIGLAFGLLGPAGVAVAFLGLFLSLSGVALVVGPRPLDRSLFRPAVALPMGFACQVVRVDAKSAPLRLGSPTRAYRLAMKAYVARKGPALGDESMALFHRAVAAADRLKTERVRWTGRWPLGAEKIQA